LPLEKNIVKKIIKNLNSLPECKAIKFHGNAFTEAGTPDVICAYRGYAVLFEVKVPGKKPAKIQEKRISEWSGAGALCKVVFSWEDVECVLSEIDNSATKSFKEKKCPSQK